MTCVRYFLIEAMEDERPEFALLPPEQQERVVEDVLAFIRGMEMPMKVRGTGVGGEGYAG